MTEIDLLQGGHTERDTELIAPDHSTLPLLQVHIGWQRVLGVTLKRRFEFAQLEVLAFFQTSFVGGFDVGFFVQPDFQVRCDFGFQT